MTFWLGFVCGMVVGAPLLLVALAVVFTEINSRFARQTAPLASTNPEG